jgi:hypothetical protein
VQSANIPWTACGYGTESKTLVGHGCGRVLLQALRAERGIEIAHPPMLAAIVVDGEVLVAGERLGTWDFFYASQGENHAPVRFSKRSTLLTVTLP